MASVLSTAGVNARKFSLSQSDAGREFVISVSKTGGITAANLYTIMNYITSAHGVDGAGDSAFTIAAVGVATDAGTLVTNSSGNIVDNVTDNNAIETVYMRVQGTGNLTLADADCGISGYAVALVAVFKPAL